MHLLLSNDDGVDAPGIAELARALAPLGRVTVVAPGKGVNGSGRSSPDSFSAKASAPITKPCTNSNSASTREADSGSTRVIRRRMTLPQQNGGSCNLARNAWRGPAACRTFLASAPDRANRQLTDDLRQGG